MWWYFDTVSIAGYVQLRFYSPKHYYSHQFQWICHLSLTLSLTAHHQILLPDQLLTLWTCSSPGASNRPWFVELPDSQRLSRIWMYLVSNLILCTNFLNPYLYTYFTCHQYGVKSVQYHIVELLHRYRCYWLRAIPSESCSPLCRAFVL